MKSALTVLLDYVFLFFVVAPLISLYWCGMFFLTDHYVYPDDYIFSIWFTCILGFIGVFICHVVHEKLTDIGNQDDIVYNPLARIYSIYAIIVIVFQWRGFWYILEHYMGPGYLSAAVSTGVGLFLLAVSGCSRSSTGVVPFVLFADDKSNYFIASSKYSKKGQASRVIHFADHFFTVFFIHPSIVLVWRGLWHIQDFAIYPGQKERSGMTSVGIGASITLLCYVLQYPLSRCVRTLGRTFRFLLEQFWRFVVVTSAVFYWRGLWVFFELFLKKDLFSMWFVAIATALILCVLNVWNIATLKGVCVDPSLNSQEDSIRFEVHYFRDMLETFEEKVKTVENQSYLPVTVVSEKNEEDLMSTNNNDSWSKLPESSI